MFGGVCISRGPHFLISWVFFAVFWASAILKKDGWLLTTSYYSSSPKRSPLTAIDSLLPESLAAPLKGMFRTEADKWCTFNDNDNLPLCHSFRKPTFPWPVPFHPCSLILLLSFLIISLCLIHPKDQNYSFTELHDAFRLTMMRTCHLKFISSWPANIFEWKYTTVK